MDVVNFLLIITIYAIVWDVSCSTACTDERGCHIWKMSLDRKTDHYSEWVTTLSADVDSPISSKNSNFDVIYSVVELNGRRKFSMRGVSKDRSPTTVADGKLYFHRRHGKNVAITGDGRTVQKINLDQPLNSIAFTNRPLKNDEVFEIRLEKKNTKFTNSLGMGVLLHSPDDIDLPPQFYKTSLAWILHNDKIYQNSTVVLENYGRNINDLKVGDRLGVMRSRFGALHFFINGVDQGPALVNVQETVYGLLELWYNAAKATIVDQ